MSKILVFLSALAMLALSSPASAQGLMGGFHWSNDTTGNDDFGRCAQRDRDNPERTLRSCSRLIADRQSSAVTAGAYCFRGLMYDALRDESRAQSDFQRAYDYFNIALGNDRRNPDSYSNRAAVLYLLRRYEEAVADYQTALQVADGASGGIGTRVRSAVADRRQGQIASLHSRLGAVHFRNEDWRNAIAAFDQAAALDADNAAYQGVRCEARAAAGLELDVAQAACEEAVRLSEGGGRGLFSRGLLQFRAGRYDAAFTDFSAAFAADPEEFLALHARGVSAIRLGREAEGRADIEQANAELITDAIAYYDNAGLRP